MKYLLDTTFVIDHLRDDPDAIARFHELLDAGDEAMVTGVVVSETWAGSTGPGDDQVGDSSGISSTSTLDPQGRASPAFGVSRRDVVVERWACRMP